MPPRTIWKASRRSPKSATPSGKGAELPDYSSRIDAETWAFIERTDSFHPAGTADLPLEKRREIYDRMCRAFFAGYPAAVSAESGAIGADGRRIPIRRYRRANADDAAIVLYHHGGGFILGGLESHDDVCAELCQRTGFEVVSVDYRLAPEHRHPAAFDDARAAFEWAAGNDGRAILLCGDSAGGNLAAAVAGTARRHARAPIGQVLIYPVLGGDQTRDSHVAHAEAPMLSVRDLAFYDEMRSGGADFSGDPTYAPLADRDFSGLPPTVIVSAECDPLASDGEAYRDAILAAGGKAVWLEEKGLVHGHLRARHTVRRAADSFTRIADALAALGKRQWPY